MAMFCPRCANSAVEGQRYCRTCGMNLGVILDAMEGKTRGPLDFETLKSDLKDLGSSLRAGFEQAGMSFKNTKRFDQNPSTSSQSSSTSMPIHPQTIVAEVTREVNKNVRRAVDKALHRVRAANTRKYSLQQATISIFGGGAWMAVWYQLLNAAANSGLIGSIEQTILLQTGTQITGLAPVLQLLWMLGFIPVARGVGHLINGLFFVPKLQPEPEEPVAQEPGYTYSMPYATPVSAVPPASYIASNTTNDLEDKAASASQSSVTEDSTLRFGQSK